VGQIGRKSVVTLAMAVLIIPWSAATALATSGTFTVIASPNKGTSTNELLGVAAPSAGDAWSVGYYQSATCVCSQRTLGEHWNGTAWSIVSTPNPATSSGDYDVLAATAAPFSSDVWAVGYSGNVGEAADKSLIERWNGTRWSVVASPNPYTTQDLYGVAAVSSGDVWAVGGYFNYSPYGYGALIEHWNGTTWSKVSNPATIRLSAVTALASDNVWAVGGAQILHWNGTAWRIVASPQGDYSLRSVAAVSASNIWAVGYEEVPSGEGYFYRTLVEHWDGSSWKEVPDAAPYPQSSGVLDGVTALSGTSVWAAGTANGLSFVERWTGTQWTRASSSNVGTSNNTFQAVAAISGHVWAVGEWYQAASPYQAQTLVEEANLRHTA
jgi:hypothetical protein